MSSLGVPVEQRAICDVDNTGRHWLAGLYVVKLDGTVGLDQELGSRRMSKQTGYVSYAKEALS